MKRKDVVANFLRESSITRDFRARSRLYHRLDRKYYAAFESAALALEDQSESGIRKIAKNTGAKMQSEFGSCKSLGLPAFGFYGKRTDILLPVMYSADYAGLEKILVSHCVDAMSMMGETRILDYAGLVGIAAGSSEAKLGHALHALSRQPYDFGLAKVRFCLSMSFGNDEVDFSFRKRARATRRKIVEETGYEKNEPEEEEPMMGAAFRSVIGYLQREEIASNKELRKFASQFQIDTMESMGYISPCGIGCYEATDKGTEAYGAKDSFLSETPTNE